MRRLFIGLMAVACIFGVASTASARVIHVAPRGYSSFDGPGNSWTNAYYTISGALAVAVAGDELWVRRSVYDEAITIPSGVAVYGGFIGNETALSQRPAFPRVTPDENETRINCEYVPFYSAVTIPANATSNTRIDGFTVYGSHRSSVFVGAGGSPFITNNTIRGGRADVGGGIFVDAGAAAQITKNTIIDCSAVRGGGIYVLGALTTITFNTLDGNRALCDKYDGDAYGSGGGIYVGSSILIANNILRNNIAYHKGGAITCAFSSPVITGNLMHHNGCADGNNYSTYNNEQGGAIYCYDRANPVITNNTMCRNAALRGGGAICIDDSSGATIKGNIFYRNEAYSGYGMAVLNLASISAVQMDYNNAWDYDWTVFYHNVTPGPHEMAVDPNFVNPTLPDPDYHLASGSQCVDKGYSGASGLQATDIDGQTRINGPAPDMGYDEYQLSITSLTNDTPVWQTAIPGLYWFQILNGKWAAVGIAPTVDHDIQAANNPWMSPAYSSSTYGGSTRDFIVANGQTFGDATHYARVYYGEMGSHIIEADWNATSVAVDGSTSGAVTAGEVVDVYQSTLLSGKTYQISVNVTSGTPDLSLFVFSPTRTSASRFSADWASQSGAAGADEQLYANTTESGTYGIIIVNEDTTQGSYTLSITEKAPVTISGHIANFAGTNMARTGVSADNGGGSATTDLSGNYTLTVPYNWSGNVSPARSGWAFVPASLAYANLITNTTGANFTCGQVTSIGSTKSLPDGRSVYLIDKPVTALFGSDVYIEDADRVGGILVVGGATFSTSVTLGGVLATADGERRIDSPIILSSGSSTVTPLYISNASIGGAAATYAPGIPGTTGLNNIGLLVRTSGVVTGVSDTVFYVNDGSNVVDVPGTLGIRVDTGGLFSSPPVGKRVVVTGISSVWMNGSTATRQLRPRNATDVQRLYKIALIHGADTSRATEINNLAESNNIDTTLIPDSQLAETYLAPFDALLISSDSLVYQSPQNIAWITNSGLPVMGMGTGGSRYFDARGIYIGWSNSSTTSGPSTIVPRVTASPIFHSPYEVYGSTITPYSFNVSAVLVYMPSPVEGVTRLASPPDPAGSYYVLCSQSRCLLWGYENGAHQMTSAGQDLFINAIYYTLGL